jgi:1-acyl-sn-glycerol-3-phosphate acyltransferase
LVLPKGWALNDMSPRYRLFRLMMRSLGFLFLGLEVHGEEKASEEGPLIVAANHRRFFDPVFVSMAVPRRVRWMAKKELFAFPFGKLFSFLGTFPVDRQGGGRTALRTAMRFLAEGRALGIFPEGTRRKEGVSPEAKSGAALLAARSGAPVLPIFADKIPGPVARLRGAKFHVYVGAPILIDNTDRGREGYRRVADELLRAIYTLPEKHGRRRSAG